MKTSLLLLKAIFCLLFSFQIGYSQVTATSSIDVATPIMTESRLLFGITMDSRTGMTGTNGQVGYINPDGSLIPEVDPLFSDFPVTSLRYPGNGIGTGFDWKKSIGLPANARPTQDILANAGPAQAVEFGFDEFMSWTASKGVSPADVHIMVSIYDDATTWPDQIQQHQALPNIVQHCADWVEYANSPNDGSNPGGGTDWAAIRAANGHPNPYGIELWNMGNEPWTSHEFTSSVTGCNQYLSLIPPIIDAMLAIDPTIKITLATVGNNVGPNSWHYTILNSSLVASGKIYGLSPHAFPVESGTNTKVSNYVSTYTSLAANCQAKGLKMILGDYAQGIPQFPPTQAEKDIAMQWEGTILAMDFLLGMSKINNLERVNFWVYGMPSAVWHPIRLLNGVYTLMPVAQLYKTMFPLVLDHSISTTNTSTAGSDGNPYGLNTSAFASSDQTAVNLISVNRDVNDTHEFQLSTLVGYNLLQARLLTATSPSSETIIETPILPNAIGNYIIPPMSILVLEYAIATSQPSITSVSQTSLCQDQTLTITGMNLANVSSVSIGGANVNFTSISSTTIDVTFNTSVSGQIQIVSSGQTITSAQNVNVYALPIANITANGNTTFCQGQSVDLSSNASTGNVWNDASTNQQLNVTNSGDYFVTVTDGNGCSANSNVINVFVNPNPTASISASGNTTFCQGGSVDLSSNSTIGNVWNNSSSNQQLNATSSGDYFVTVTDGNGCTAISNTITVLVNSNPTASISANGNTTFCQGGNVDLSSNSSTGNVWNDGSTNQQLNVSSSGDYFVTITDGNGCSATSNSVNIVVNSLPNVSVTSDLTSISATNGNGTYQWLDCTSSLAILGEINTTYSPMNSGDYAVIITENGCVDTSLCVSFNISNTSINELEENQLHIYPNPTDLQLNFSKYLNEFIITNNLGQVIYRGKGNAVSTVSFESGIYFLTSSESSILFHVIH